MENKNLNSFEDFIAESGVKAADGKFISFLLYCAERLQKGEPVQAIWNGYLEKDN